jgi:hypothetical protein
MAKHFSDVREPKNQSKTHWSVPQIHNFNQEANGGSDVDDSREHVTSGPQTAANYGKPSPFSKKRK